MEKIQDSQSKAEMIMDGDEMEMTREELQRFILERVNHRLLMSENVWKKCSQLQSLWEQREKLSMDLIKHSETVFKCEAIVKELYSKLGWEYEDMDSGGNKRIDIVSNSDATVDDIDDIRSASPLSNDVTTANSDDEYPEILEVTSIAPEQNKIEAPTKELRVVLDRLPMTLRPRRAIKPSSPKPGTSRQSISDDELSNVDSDYLPSNSSDSDFGIKSSKSDKQKKKKMVKLGKRIKIDVKPTPVTQKKPIATIVPTKPEPATNVNDTNGASAAPNIKSEVKTEVNTEVKTEAKPIAVIEKKKPAPAATAASQEPKVGLKVLARRKKIWEAGKIADIHSKDDGTMKYKVQFEDNGKVLVSGHHIAFDTLPKLAQLTVGGRVLCKLKPEDNFYSPGILGELPSRKNHMRFLIFFDDQKTLYMSLPVLRVVCIPLADPLEDIRNEEHKGFMKEYLQRMPYPPHTQFRVSQKINVMRHGALESCTVLQLDCSLMEVAYDNDEEKEWIYRGSIRLEHIMNMKDKN